MGEVVDGGSMVLEVKFCDCQTLSHCREGVCARRRGLEGVVDGGSMVLEVCLRLNFQKLDSNFKKEHRTDSSVPFWRF